jgi:hypothetical protein
LDPPGDVIGNLPDRQGSTFEFAKRRLNRFKNVEVLFGRSAELLAERLRSIAPNVPALAYPDAHWEGDLPLADEIDAICNTLSRFVVIIDDFEVPDDSGYNFDNSRQRISTAQLVEIWHDFTPRFAPKRKQECVEDGLF